VSGGAFREKGARGIAEKRCNKNQQVGRNVLSASLDSTMPTNSKYDHSSWIKRRQHGRVRMLRHHHGLALLENGSKDGLQTKGDMDDVDMGFLEPNVVVVDDIVQVNGPEDDGKATTPAMPKGIAARWVFLIPVRVWPRQPMWILVSPGCMGWTRGWM
jgi:hypothetical protein